MKDQNFAGQASWMSSNINLVNTSTYAPEPNVHLLTNKQLSAQEF